MRTLTGLLLSLALMLLLPFTARAEEMAQEVDTAIDALDLSGWQAAADEAGADLEVAQMIRQLAQGEMSLEPETLLGMLRSIVLGEADGLGARLMALMGPALLWAVNRQLLRGEGLGEAAGYVCYLAGVGVMLGSFASYMTLAAATVRRMRELTAQVFPILTALMTAVGRPGTAGALKPLAVLAGGAMSAFVERILSVLCGSAAVLAAAGNLSERISLNGLFRLCLSVGGWLLGAVMTAFLGMTSISGLMGGARDGVTIRAAKYAVDNLLPVVGGDVADAMGTMAASAGLVKSAAGVTGMILMLAVCLRPVISLAVGMLLNQLAAALTETVSGGPLRACMEQMGQILRLMLAAVAVSAALFIMLTGACLTAG